MTKIRISILSFLCASCVFADGEYTLTYRGLMINDSSAHARKVFEGISIDDYSVKSVASGTNPKYQDNTTYLNGSGRFDFLPLSEERYEKNGVKCLETVLQSCRKYGSQYSTYQYTVILEQRGEDVYGYLSSVYVGADLWLIGRNMQPLYNDANDFINIAKGGLAYDLDDETYKKAMGVDCITIVRKEGPSISENHTTSVDGDLSVPSNVGYVADGAMAIAEGEYAGKMKVDGILTIRNPVVKKFSGEISGDGDLFVEAASFAAEIESDVEHDKDFFIENKWKRVATDRLLSSLTNVTAILCGSRAGQDKKPDAYGHWRNNGAYAVVQVYSKVSSSWQTGCLLRMRQNGRNIEACIASYSYDEPWKNGFNEKTYQYGDINFETMASKCRGMSIPTSRNENGSYDGKGQVGLHSLKLFFAEGSMPQITVFSGKNSMETGSVVRVSGTDKATMLAEFTSDALPSHGKLVVDAGGRAVFSGSVNMSRLTVNKGGMVFQGASQCLSATATHGVHLNGGTMVIGYYDARNSVLENYEDAGLYLNYMHFENGARLLGSAPRVGYGMNPRWYVSGDSVSVCATGIGMYPMENARDNSPITIEVEDVTGDAQADFRITNPVRLFYPVGNADFEAHKSAYIRKEGPGTVSMEAEFSPYLPSVMAGGTWKFAHKNSASASTDFKLDGGNLEIADGIALTMGEVIPSVASTITLGEGASVSIKSPTAAWPEDGSVNFVVSDIASRSSIRFGESASLSAAHSGAIRVNGKIVAQNSAGYLRPVAFRVIVR